MSYQRRETPRIPVEIRVKYRQQEAADAELTQDISGGGLFIKTRSPLPEGEECVFTLELAILAAPLALKGVVRRVSAEGMGVELLFEDDLERQALKRIFDAVCMEALGGALFDRVQRIRDDGGDHGSEGLGG